MANSRCGLLFQILIVDLLRGPVLKSGVPTPRIVPEFDVPHNVLARVLPGWILGTVNALILQRGEKRFGHGIVVALSLIHISEPTRLGMISYAVFCLKKKKKKKKNNNT